MQSAPGDVLFARMSLHNMQHALAGIAGMHARLWQVSAAPRQLFSESHLQLFYKPLPLFEADQVLQWYPPICSLPATRTTRT